MVYPFPSIERSVYPRTFLKDVRLAADFPKVSLGSVEEERLNSFFSQFFSGVSVDLNKICEGIRLQSQDGVIHLFFSLDKIVIQLRQPFYKKFEQAEEFLLLMINYFETLSVAEVRKLTVSKFNELKFRNTAPNFAIIKIMQSVFSKELLGMVEAEQETFDKMVRWEKAVSLDGSAETGTMFSAECGFRRAEPNSQDGSLTLTTRVESTGKVVVDKLLDTAQGYNQILDEAFHWCVNEEVIEKMQEQ